MTTTEQQQEIEIRYEGPGVAGEIWGSTQANFTVFRPQAPAREIAVMVNDAACERLAAELNTPDTPEFREGAARVVGRIAVRRHWERFNRLDSILTIAAATLDEDPVILDEVRAILAAPQAAPPPERMAPQH